MEAASKNKRGRPKIYGDMLYSIYFDKEKRTAQNTFYVGVTIKMMDQKPGDFFVTEKGNLRRQGIAEQIGRMYNQDGYPEESFKDVCQTAIDIVKDGYSVKDVERWIRHGRTTGEW